MDVIRLVGKTASRDELIGLLHGVLVGKTASRDELIVLLRDTEEQRQKLQRAVQWALGEGDSDFGDNKPENAEPFWWREELRERAGM